MNRRHFTALNEIHHVSDLIGELQEMQSATNTSTAAELLKQGAGTSQALYFHNVDL